ncbi:12370_t:CDS:2, partial [Cetraspora pellucida]
MSKQGLEGFENFEKHLDPNNLSLIAILKFRPRLSEIPKWSKTARSLKKDGILVSVCIFCLKYSDKEEVRPSLSKQLPSYSTSFEVVMNTL